jgi:hypothetical protein
MVSMVRVLAGTVQAAPNNVTLIIVIRGLESLVNLLIYIHIMPYDWHITLNSKLGELAQPGSLYFLCFR